MIEEYRIDNKKSVTINIQANELNEVREKSIDYNSTQIFNDGKIYSANQIGEASADQLKSRALENPYSALDYDFEYRAKEQMSVEGGKALNSNELIDLCQDTLSSLRTRMPDFLFSGKFDYIENKHLMKNSLGGRYESMHRNLGGFVTMKLKGSPNIMDSFFVLNGHTGQIKMDEVPFYFDLHNEFTKEVQVEPGRYPVIMDQGFASKILESLAPDAYHGNSAFYSGKLGQKIFNEKINIDDVRYEEEMGLFETFDNEGVKLTPRLSLIENGIFKNIVYDRRSAKKFGAKTTGNGRRSFKSAISATPFNPLFSSTGESFEDIFNSHERVIVTLIAGGGDITSEGDYSSPVQLGFLVENSKVVGRIPQVSMRNNIDSIMGEDFIGVTNNKIFLGPANPYVSYMNIF